MLTNDQERYLLTIPEDKKVIVLPYSQDLARIANSFIAKVKTSLPMLEVVFMGAAGLGISGQGDIDLYALSQAHDFHSFLPTLKWMFGKPNHEHLTSVEWSFTRDGHDVEFYLTDSQTETMQQQIKVFELLKQNKNLLDEYQKLKETMNGKSMRDYQRKKYEFYNRILDNQSKA